MTVSIIHALLRWILGVFAPGTGRRRACARSAEPAAPHIAAQRDAGTVRRLPAARSPYGLPELLDGAATIPVRPYVCVAERAHHGRERELEQQRTRQTQTRRRRALVLAADFGIDLDRHVVGAERAA
ncbi:hypothetical protein P1S61_40710 [Streptomyces sp. ME08-AFT2]|uniref:hypothetical protein n=1 Tax=Streptomyces sp. ME08-AFT2 TaxID=3028683 RepID=UPI0029A3DFF0|nr:hypothetical protein [Streptomyces sp. ME08-AFT2]MDX3315260.1 hypothetical protein [Streptomyces sp. ME08-AFT2]